MFNDLNSINKIIKLEQVLKSVFALMTIITIVFHPMWDKFKLSFEFNYLLVADILIFLITYILKEKIDSLLYQKNKEYWQNPKNSCQEELLEEMIEHHNNKREDALHCLALANPIYTRKNFDTMLEFDKND